LEWKLVVVAENNIVLNVERRNSILLTIVVRVDLLLQIGRPVQRLAEAVAGDERESPTGTLQRELERVVVRIAHVGKVSVASNRIAEGRARTVDDSPVRPRVNAVLSKRSAGRCTRSNVLRLTKAEALRRLARVSHWRS